MSIPNIAGYWTGKISGTNFGGFILDIKQDGEKVSGSAKLMEQAVGHYEYIISGTVNKGKSFSFQLVPGRRSAGLMLGVVHAVCEIIADDEISGRWKSEIGTEGIFSAKKYNVHQVAVDLPKSNSVFLVHGHDEGAKHAVARFLEQIGVKPVILQEQISRGMTIIEKFEDFAARAGFAIVLMTPDDVGYPTGKEEEKKMRPRQNVIMELGYFAGKLGRSRVLVLTRGDLEMPSDIIGLAYEPMDKNDGWKMRIARELKATDFKIDMNKAIG